MCDDVRIKGHACLQAADKGVWNKKKRDKRKRVVLRRCWTYQGPQIIAQQWTEHSNSGPRRRTEHSKDAPVKERSKARQSSTTPQ